MDRRTFGVALGGLVVLGAVFMFVVVGGRGGGISGDLGSEFGARATERSLRFERLAERGDAAAAYPFLAAPESPAAPQDPTDIVARVGPSVVTVVSLRGTGSFQSGGEIGRGTGFIVAPDGYVISNWHVVTGGERFRVLLSDGDEREATLVGSDRISDLSVLQVEGEIPATVPLGDSDALQAGQPVLAIGSPLGDFTNTVTRGIVSGLGRTIPGAAFYSNLVQHDAAINPGNSEGPLFNLAGEVVGVNTLGISVDAQVGPAAGIFFAIPANTVREIAALLIRDGAVVYPFLGVEFEPVTPSLVALYDLPVEAGIIILDVEDGTPADAAGIRANDVILAIEERPLDVANPLIEVLMGYAPGETVTVTVWRNGDEFETDLTLGERPEEEG